MDIPVAQIVPTHIPTAIDVEDVSDPVRMASSIFRTATAMIIPIVPATIIE